MPFISALNHDEFRCDESLDALQAATATATAAPDPACRLGHAQAHPPRMSDRENSGGRPPRVRRHGQWLQHRRHLLDARSGGKIPTRATRELRPAQR
ncbi:hypothetical protein ISF_01414 [Cordyceps fumosorosea ARSEF 2679]|uniref:Uncharacterized protein n=1 Tax=Cordyceps fumosorosea (strain ARSEF 2679) TaxID=1081104 RepID=A0A168D9W7_CORFA|nr:hypothetical protein ISF_01414 [Cordyceps fumosorosea ARSEF 2679]OAA72341.1 hypothetical protein ISF_01414 [Cordyceps fumosorosea ARSEF 2679]